MSNVYDKHLGSIRQARHFYACANRGKNLILRIIND